MRPPSWVGFSSALPRGFPGHSSFHAVQSRLRSLDHRTGVDGGENVLDIDRRQEYVWLDAKIEDLPVAHLIYISKAFDDID